MSLPISLEFFPPKTPEGAAKLRTARKSLYELKPEFCWAEAIVGRDMLSKTI